MKVFKESFWINPLPSPLPTGPTLPLNTKQHNMSTNKTFKRLHVNDFLSLTPFRNKSSIVNIWQPIPFAIYNRYMGIRNVWHSFTYCSTFHYLLISLTMWINRVNIYIINKRISKVARSIIIIARLWKAKLRHQ